MDYKSLVGKYYEQNKIKEVEELKTKTNRGKAMIKLVFENDKTQDLPVEVSTYLVKDEPIDATALREEVVKPLIAEIVEVLLERQIRIIDMDYLFLKLNDSINLSITSANNKIWGVTSEEKTLVDIDKVLMAKTK